jgi:hypothetical protein
VAVEQAVAKLLAVEHHCLTTCSQLFQAPAIQSLSAQVERRKPTAAHHLSEHFCLPVVEQEHLTRHLVADKV